ncbi:MAG: metal-dependent transcriptional regulator [bacterium]
MARPTTNQSIEDYLEAILVIQQQKGHCRSVDVANRLNYTKASVSVAVANLTRLGYLHKLADGHLALTEAGRAYAASVLDRHRLLTSALTRIGVPSDIADADACRIEHDISPQTFDRLREWHARVSEA